MGALDTACAAAGGSGIWPWEYPFACFAVTALSTISGRACFTRRALPLRW
jgi:hypothetical protein